MFFKNITDNSHPYFLFLFRELWYLLFYTVIIQKYVNN
jgi:hypothetical protein